jgi:IMP cyclohydrolase
MQNPFSRYPGRFIVIGKDADAYVALYGATGRSPASLARKFVRHDNEIFMTAADDTVSKEKNPELFEYPALRVLENGLVIANGTQIGHIASIENRDAKKQLSYALSEEAYEPDEFHTPRITGLMVETGQGIDAALHIARLAPDGIDRSSWNISLESGKGFFISTYRGEDARPAPSFSGDPISVPLAYGSAHNAAQSIFDSFTPPAGEPDYRVGVIAAYLSPGKEPEIAIVNRIRN